MDKLLEKFDGRSREKAYSWIFQFKSYVAYKRCDDVTTTHFFPLCITNIALEWFNFLPDSVTNNIDNIYTAFQDRFFTSPILNYVTVSSLFHTYQQADEPVQEFISKIKSSARKIHIENDIICYAILNGLKAEIRCVVLRNATSINLDSIEHWASLAEVTHVDEDAEMRTKLEDLIQDIEKLKVKMAEGE